MSYYRDFINLLYPKCCSACGRALVTHEEALCFSCQVALPRTLMHDEPDNHVEKLLWSRVPMQAATAFLRMPRHGMVHQLMHELKYRNNPAVGQRLGKLFGLELAASERMKQIEVILPVPLHPRRFKVRGYNQCEAIARGMSEAMNVEVDQSSLKRVQFNETQTKRGGRWKRWCNVSEIFELADTRRLAGKKVLLIDDVITTGSTIEACANQLQRISGLQLFVGALAYPVN